MTGINEFAKEIHENAVAHGWWDEGVNPCAWGCMTRNKNI